PRPARTPPAPRPRNARCPRTPSSRPPPASAIPLSDSVEVDPRGQPAVNDELGAGAVRALVGGEEEHQAGDVLRGTETARGDTVEPATLVAADRPQHGRVDAAGMDGVDTD